MSKDARRVVPARKPADFTVGKLYVLPREVKNPGGLKRGRYGVRLHEVACLPEGTTLKCLSRKQLLARLTHDPEYAKSFDDVTPFALLVTSEVDFFMDVGSRRESQTLRQGILHLDPQEWRPEFEHVRAWPFFAELIDTVLEKAPVPSDNFRDAGYPFDERYDGGFVAVVKWAAESGLLSLDQFLEWVEKRRQLDSTDPNRA